MEVWRGNRILSGSTHHEPAEQAGLPAQQAHDVWIRFRMEWVVFGPCFDDSAGEGFRVAENFYSSSCPNAESIVKQTVDIKRSQAPPTIAGTLRLFFHDCFVERCDASIMIASPTGDAEKNFTEICRYQETGVSHCNRFSDRLYNFSSSSPVDPSLNPDYAKRLKVTCSKEVDPGEISDLDPDTPFTFDNVYYKNLVGGKGLFSSDQVLFSDSASQPTVLDFAKSPGNFNGAVITAIRKLGRVGVKTGNQGEIRRDCTTFNS
ncbi:peroxidase 55-like [Pyrus ussuriensis x Pyrus communis]|uniref:peroxidase n=1 Tax=Pyrus ussuriensis x Pyrus communis TaxID=2448454 RepID=A0A5N5GFM1_9ROSA|nr:peroxidase 55-like [Pyrus ussuriensis x Pyrus communis]